MVGTFSSLTILAYGTRMPAIQALSFSFVQPMGGAPSEGRIIKAVLQALGRPDLDFVMAWNDRQLKAALSTQIKEVNEK